MSITISVLLENRPNHNAKSSLRAKAGLSLFIQDENDSILFDTGPDDSFLHNAGLMGVDLTCLTAAVLSHGHYDHCGGVPWLPDRMPSPRGPRALFGNTVFGVYRQTKKTVAE